jgi:hypothetical protein
MRIVCIANVGFNLSAKHFSAGYLQSSEFDLQLGKEYVVYGISIWKGILGFLAVGEGGYPHWYPAEIFTVSRNEVPSEWYFAFYLEREGAELNAVWGYDELVNSETYFDELSNLGANAISIFQARRRQMDSEA